MAQNYFENQFYSPADNLSVFMFGIFGFFGLVLITLYTITLAKYAQNSSQKQIYYWCGCVVLLEGWTINVIENPVLSLVFGFTFYIYVSPLLRSFSKIGRKMVPTKAIGISKDIKMDTHESDFG